MDAGCPANTLRANTSLPVANPTPVLARGGGQLQHALEDTPGKKTDVDPIVPDAKTDESAPEKKLGSISETTESSTEGGNHSDPSHSMSESETESSPSQPPVSSNDGQVTRDKETNTSLTLAPLKVKLLKAENQSPSAIAQLQGLLRRMQAVGTLAMMRVTTKNEQSFTELWMVDSGA